MEEQDASAEAGVSVPEPPQETSERELLEQEIVRAAEDGDRLRFDAAVARFGDIEEARSIVRKKAVLRSVDRLARRQPSDIEIRSEVEERSAETNGEGQPVMHGHFSVFNEFTEIDSYFEGRFLERVAPGAYKKTFRENRPNIKVLFQHGQDPMIGDKPLGPVDDLREDSTGAYYEVPLLDAPYTKDLEPGLREGLYGASFRFKAIQDEWVDDAERSATNPEGLPERTLKELRVFEFGPVTFPAYPGATAGLRSADIPGAVQPAPSDKQEPVSSTPDPERREPKPNKRFKNSEDWTTWLNTVS